MLEKDEPAVKERVSCPRCGAPFVCRSDDITACHCKEVTLDVSLRDAITKYYRGCLCAACLQQIAKGTELQR